MCYVTIEESESLGFISDNMPINKSGGMFVLRASNHSSCVTVANQITVHTHTIKKKRIQTFFGVFSFIVDKVSKVFINNANADSLFLC